MWCMFLGDTQAVKSTGYSLRNPLSENLAAQLDDLDELTNGEKKAEIQARRERRKQVRKPSNLLDVAMLYYL